MNIISVNNSVNFQSKIKYDRELKKAFNLSKRRAVNTESLESMDSSKKFIDNIYAVLKSDSKDVIDFSSKNKKNFDSSIKAKDMSNNNPVSDAEALKCILNIDEYAKDLPANSSYLDNLRDQIEGVQALLDELKENYSKAMIKNLKSLEHKIKYSK